MRCQNQPDPVVAGSLCSLYLLTYRLTSDVGVQVLAQAGAPRSRGCASQNSLLGAAPLTSDYTKTHIVFDYCSRLQQFLTEVPDTAGIGAVVIDSCRTHSI